MFWTFTPLNPNTKSVKVEQEMRPGSSHRTGRYCSKRPSGKIPYSLGPKVLSARMANITLSKTKESTPCTQTIQNRKAYNSFCHKSKKPFLIIHLHNKTFTIKYKTLWQTNLQNGTIDSEEDLARFFFHTVYMIRQTTQVQLVTQTPTAKQGRKYSQTTHTQGLQSHMPKYHYRATYMQVFQKIRQVATQWHL